MHLGKKLPCVFLVLCDGIGTCQTLPIDSAEKRPAPFVVPAGLRGRIEHPVDRTVELVSEDVMLHDLLGICNNTDIPYFSSFGGLKQIDGVLSFGKMPYQALPVKIAEVFLKMCP